LSTKMFKCSFGRMQMSNSKVRSILSTALSFDYVVDARGRKRRGIYGAQ
jgi:hypothetical protein